MENLAQANALASGDALLNVDQVLLKALILGTQSGIQMTGLEPIPVGASRLTQARHPITVMVGLVGKHSGNLAFNLSERGLLRLVSTMLGEPLSELNEESVDAIMELGNMIAGSVKSSLCNTGYAISHISLPSLVLGAGVSVVFARGIKTVSVEFEIPGLSFNTMNDRFFSTTISLLQASGV